jgi:uncharacterized protein (TIGR00730 family)
MNITVYCGSRKGNDPSFAAAAAELGRWIAKNGHTLVYGGGNVGLMGVIADEALKGGGTVTGVIPEFLIEAEKGHEGLHTLEVVPDMQARKRRMLELGDAFLAMPGGIGTLEEISEAVSLKHLGSHSKPCVFLNVDGYYDTMKDLFRGMVDAGFLAEDELSKMTFADSVEEAAAALST